MFCRSDAVCVTALCAASCHAGTTAAHARVAAPSKVPGHSSCGVAALSWQCTNPAGNKNANNSCVLVVFDTMFTWDCTSASMQHVSFGPPPVAAVLAV